MSDFLDFPNTVVTNSEHVQSTVPVISLSSVVISCYNYEASRYFRSEQKTKAGNSDLSTGLQEASDLTP